MYKLRAELRAHESDVRGIASCPYAPSTNIIATGSRDKTIGIWDINSTSKPVRILRGHTHFVNAVKFIDDKTLVSASNDKTIRVWNFENGECLKIIEGHTSSICSIATLLNLNNSRCIITSSWDCTSRLWNIDNGKCICELIGHSASVWSCCNIIDNQFITVAADKSIRLWDINLNNSTNTDFFSTTSSTIISTTVHTDVVRDVVTFPSSSSSSLPGCEFVTVANDSRLVTWKKTGNTYVPSATLSDLHDGSYIYSVDTILSSTSTSTFITGGEDNALRLTIMNQTDNNISVQPGQTIMHPGTVWKVCKGPDESNILTACSDGVARIFTNDETKYAEPDILSSFEKAISERQVDTRLIGGVDVTKLPDSETGLSKPGTKDGENRIVKNSSGKPEVYMWSMAEEKWTKVGDVVDGPGGTTGGGAVPGKVNGNDYDFVFEVELGDDGSKEKLGFNRGENPYLAAQRFIDENELNQEFLDQIAQFIEQQVPADALRPSNGNMPSDPLTGGSRYVPGGSGSESGPTSGDPLTGGSRYIPGGGGGGGGGGTVGGSDPLTGGSRYVPGGGGNSSSLSTATQASKALPPARKFIPHKDGMICYKSCDQLDKIQQKLSEANSELAKDLTTQHQALTINEASVFGQSLIPKLKSSRGGTDLVFSDEECEIIEKILKWPTKCKGTFAALDIGRLIISTSSGCAYFFGKKNGNILNHIIKHIENVNDANAPIYIMGCRFLCNMFGNRVVRTIAKQRMNDVIQCCMVNNGAAKCANRKSRETFASVLINYSVLCMEIKSSVEECETIVLCVVSLIKDFRERDEDVAFRLLIAMGTVMCVDDENIVKKAVELGAAQVAADCAPLSPRLQQVALDIATIIAK